jgi:hypothetical protein
VCKGFGAQVTTFDINPLNNKQVIGATSEGKVLLFNIELTPTEVPQAN